MAVKVLRNFLRILGKCWKPTTLVFWDLTFFFFATSSSLRAFFFQPNANHLMMEHFMELYQISICCIKYSCCILCNFYFDFYIPWVFISFSNWNWNRTFLTTHNVSRKNLFCLCVLVTLTVQSSTKLVNTRSRRTQIILREKPPLL